MTSHPEALYRGVSHAAWGYLFLYLDVNLGTVSILPAFVGYLLFWSAIGALEGEVRDLSLLRPPVRPVGRVGGSRLALFLDRRQSGRLLLSSGRDPPGRLLYFHFQLFTDLALLAARYQPEGADLDRHLLRLRTLQVLLLTGLALVGPLSDLCGGPAPWLSVALSLAGLLVSLALMNRLRTPPVFSPAVIHSNRPPMKWAALFEWTYLFFRRTASWITL
ncbi:hypothetical protein [Evtepia gabavorous]|uniref:hypothetical protein n=1 Tax=Evtepia gabavorous TaxID=2211183 RepID=UPI003991B9A2